ncbi:MAG: PorT family protein [Culturomica sp.]|nr:PorT family protein [Culturomica sp.]
MSFGRKFDHIVLPVLAKFYVWKGLSVDVGPQFGYLVSAKHEVNDMRNNSDELKKFGLSVVAGLSCKIAGHYDISARLNFGQTKVYRSCEAKNCSYSLGVGYRF